MSNNRIDYVKLLPKTLQEQLRWSQFISVVQSIIEDIRINKIDIIKTQYQLEHMTEQQLIDLASTLGSVIVSLDGYTAERTYLLKEVLTLIPRILNRNNRPGYQTIFQIFNLVGEIYPMYLNSFSKLVPIENFWEYNETTIIVDTLDSGGDFVLFKIPNTSNRNQTSNSGLTSNMYFEVSETPKESPINNTTLDDFDNFPHLDLEPFLETLTRHIVGTYQFKFVENTTEFMSENTLKAFYSDILAHKRRTEVFYFEPKLVTETTDDGNETIETYQVYDASASTTVNSILIGTDFSDVSKIVFGTGSHSVLDGTITSVKFKIYEWDIDNFEDYLSDSTHFYGRRKITQKNTMFNFKEIALLDSLGNCIYYVKFPWIKYLSDSKFYSNIYLDFTLTS